MGGNEVLAGIEKEKLIVIFRGVPTEDAADVARALADGGVKFIEITYNHCKDTLFVEFSVEGTSGLLLLSFSQPAKVPNKQVANITIAIFFFIIDTSNIFMSLL